MGTERESITKEVGSRIRYARKSRGMSCLLYTSDAADDQ